MRIFSYLLSVVILVGCTGNGNKVETYVAAKPPAPAGMQGAPMGGGAMPPADGGMPMTAKGEMPTDPVHSGMGQGEVVPPPAEASAYSWKAPAGWIAEATSQFRIGSYSLPGVAEKKSASIVVLGGPAGGTVANVNRWRQQLGLPQLPEQQILAAAKKDQGKLGAFDWFEITDKGNPTAGMLTAILRSGEESIFVKVVASPEVLVKHRAQFLALCRSIKRNSSSKME